MHYHTQLAIRLIELNSEYEFNDLMEIPTDYLEYLLELNQ